MSGATKRGTLVLAAALAASSAAAGDGPLLSGAAQASFVSALGAGGTPELALSAEQYANLRMRASFGRGGELFAAVNLAASSGANAAAAAAAGASAGANYVAAVELERLYTRISSGAFDYEFGLMRFPFGYGQAFRPTDFLNPPNPMLPDARPRGALGAQVSAYTEADARLRLFAAAGPDPTRLDGGGGQVGASAEAHFARLSAQGLYAFQASDAERREAVNRLGLSLKAELEIGLSLDLLYAHAGSGAPSARGLELAAGADYSFAGGKLYALLQYLYNGPGLLDPGDGIELLAAERQAAAEEGRALGAFNRRNYLYFQSLYRFSDFTRAGLSCLASLDDRSFTPALVAEHEPIQGLTLSLSVRAALDERAIRGAGAEGELGPGYVGYYGLLNATARVRF